MDTVAAGLTGVLASAPKPVGSDTAVLDQLATMGPAEVAAFRLGIQQGADAKCKITLPIDDPVRSPRRNTKLGRALTILLPAFNADPYARMDSDTVAELCKRAKVKPATLYRHRRRYYELQGDQQAITVEAMLDSYRRVRQPNVVNAKVEAVIEWMIREYWLQPINHTGFRCATRQALLEEIVKHCRRLGLRAPADNTVKRRLDLLKAADPKRYYTLRFGQAAARDREPRLGSLDITNYGERVEMDGTLVDIFVDAFGRLRLRMVGQGRAVAKQLTPSRLWINVVVDSASTVILSLRLSPQGKSSFESLRALERVLLGVEDDLRALGVQHLPPPMGKMHRLVTDGGSEYENRSIALVCRSLTIDHDSPPGGPHLRGLIERVIGLINEALAHLPGAKGIWQRARGPQERRAVVLRPMDVSRYLTLFAFDRHNVSVPRGWQVSRLETALTLIAQGRSMAKPVAPTEHDRVRRLLMPAVEVQLTKTGATHNYCRYVSPAAVFHNLIRNRKPGQKLTLLLNPHDVSQGLLLHPTTDELIEVHVPQMSTPVSRWEWDLAKQHVEHPPGRPLTFFEIYEKVLAMRALDEALPDTPVSVKRQQKRDDSARQVEPRSTKRVPNLAFKPLTVSLAPPVRSGPDKP